MVAEPSRPAVIWVARPAAQAGTLVALLEAAGCRVIAEPVLAIEAHAEGSGLAAIARAVLATVPTCDHLIFVSANAAQTGLKLMQAEQLLPGPRTRVYAVGPSSAEVLGGRLGPVRVPEADYSSEGLLQLPELQAVAGSSVIIVRGVGGRPKLADELTRRGATVQLAELYQRQSAGKLDNTVSEALRAGRIDAVMVASGETIAYLLELAGNAAANLLQTTLVVPGARVAALARAAGFATIVEAQSALSEHMAAAWIAHSQQR